MKYVRTALIVLSGGIMDSSDETHIEMDPAEFGAFIFALATQQGCVDVSDFAKRVGATAAHSHRLLKGHTPITRGMLERIFKGLGMEWSIVEDFNYITSLQSDGRSIHVKVSSQPISDKWGRLSIEYRKQHQLTQEQFGAIVGTTQAQISDFERGNTYRSGDIFMRIRSVLSGSESRESTSADTAESTRLLAKDVIGRIFNSPSQEAITPPHIKTEEIAPPSGNGTCGVSSEPSGETVNIPITPDDALFHGPLWIFSTSVLCESRKKEGFEYLRKALAQLHKRYLFVPEHQWLIHGHTLIKELTGRFEVNKYLLKNLQIYVVDELFFLLHGELILNPVKKRGQLKIGNTSIPQSEQDLGAIAQFVTNVMSELDTEITRKNKVGVQGFYRVY
jgi:transcriptional regulator with XRE-family HTH domain